MKTLFHWIIATLAIGITTYVVPGVTVTLLGAFIAAVVLGALNLIVRPVIVILTFPITLLTLGLFTLVIDALLVMLASYVVPGFLVAGFWPAFFFAIVLAVVNWVFHLWRND
ncbi:MAG: phage holin family protein [Candidatus Paceibacterota bacterium]|jgi:putative membrane protein